MSTGKGIVTDGSYLHSKRYGVIRIGLIVGTLQEHLSKNKFKCSARFFNGC